jgi:uncharacterized membrane protein YphA (DoxX/SURF4 family)
MMRWKYPFFTAFFLVLLRLAIGWHFAYEGYHKVHSIAVGPVSRDGRVVAPFSSAGYFSEGRGPLGEVMRHAIGDPDELLLERLEAMPLASGQDPATDNKHLRMPPALAHDWEDYLNRFATHYNLDEQQRSLARVKMEQAESNFVQWLTAGTGSVVKNYPSGTVEITEPNSRRVQEYREALQNVHDVYTKELPAFGKDVEKARLLKTKDDARSLRKSLQADVDSQTEQMKKAVNDVLTDSQCKMDVLAEAAAPTLLLYLDKTTAWFLLGVGVTLLFGLFTRLSCVFAAGFLLLTYLNTPAFPWLPVPPNQEGSYYYVSKNVIEMLALLTLATTPSGRWFGIDSVLYQIGRMMFGGFKTRETQAKAS